MDETEHGGLTKLEYEQLSARWGVVGVGPWGPVVRLLLKYQDGQVCAAYASDSQIKPEWHLSLYGRVKVAYQTDGCYWTLVFPNAPVKFLDVGYVQPLAAKRSREVADHEGIQWDEQLADVLETDEFR